MLLAKFEYKEFEGDVRAWALAPASFGQINLLVGKNASGKTRLLKSMAGLAQLLAGKQQALFASGNFTATLRKPNGESFTYELAVKNNSVEREFLSFGDIQYLMREGAGPGKIKTFPEGKMAGFQIRPTQLAAFAKRDALQYPFLEEISTWADGTEHYEFAALFGPSAIGSPAMMVSIAQLTDPDKALRRDYEHREMLQVLLASAIAKFGETFKRSICADMRRVGYDLEDIGTGVLSTIQMSPPPIGIWIKERDLLIKIEQPQISSGMFRALSAVIRMNLALYATTPTTVFLDDVGEGLDFQRSVGLINTLIDKAKEGGFQLIMTTNDRFVMNEVPLNYWSVIIRTGSSVTVKNYENARDEFEKFEKLGLNNFDYFVAQSSHK